MDATPEGPHVRLSLSIYESPSGWYRCPGPTTVARLSAWERTELDVSWDGCWSEGGVDDPWDADAPATLCRCRDDYIDRCAPLGTVRYEVVGGDCIGSSGHGDLRAVVEVSEFCGPDDLVDAGPDEASPSDVSPDEAWLPEAGPPVPVDGGCACTVPSDPTTVFGFPLLVAFVIGGILALRRDRARHG